MDVIVQQLAQPPAPELQVEVVERKGLGHPDTICDALVEGLSLALCRFYLDRFGLIMHHNVDKALLWGGKARPEFGGGEVLAPIEIYLAGRATHEVKGVRVPVEELAIESSRAWLAQSLHALDPDRHVRIHSLIRPGSADLVDLFMRQRETGVWLANDTSIGVGYAPLGALERVTLGVERSLNSPEIRASHPEAGEDVKVMGVRQGSDMALTVACPAIDRYVADLDDYRTKRSGIADVAQRAAENIAGRPVAVELNTADDFEGGNVYLTVTGTSAEAGDDGQAGRGNRANGLITPYRPMTMQSVAGKNPLTHVGKVYNIGAGRIAAALVDQIAEVLAAECYLVSRIGQPVNEPVIVDLRVRIADDARMASLARRVEDIAREHIERLDRLWQQLVREDTRALID